MKKSKLLLAAAALSAAIAMPSQAQSVLGMLEPGPPVTAATFQHWKTIAAREAASLAGRLDPAAGPWNVQADTESSSYFTAAFQKLLVSELSAKGVALTTRADASRIDIQVDAKLLPSGKYQPGSLTFLAAGVWAVHAVTHALSPAGAATVLAVGADVLLSNLPERGSAEVALTLQATHRDTIAASQTNVYLIANDQSGVYVNDAPRTLNFVR